MSLKKSLKPIKKKIVENDNIFRVIRRVYTHLSDLSHQDILDYYQVGSINELHRHIEHIKGILLKREIGYKEELKELDSCFCTDGHGNFKDLYLKEKEAQQKINLLYKEQRVKLKLYPCPYNCGWHLTKG